MQEGDSVPNPYAHGQPADPVREFAGREAELRRIRACVESTRDLLAYLQHRHDRGAKAQGRETLPRALGRAAPLDLAIDVLDCPKCSGRMKLIAFITGAGTARQILEHLELPTTGPPTAKAERMGSDEPDPAPEYDLVDPTWEE